jgi:hypothetical protein
MTAAEETRVEYADGRLLVKAPRRLRELSPSATEAGEPGSLVGLRTNGPRPAARLHEICISAGHSCTRPAHAHDDDQSVARRPEIVPNVDRWRP